MPLLPAHSLHPKAAKREIVASLIVNAQRRSCHHEVGNAPSVMINSPPFSGYSSEVMSSVISKLFFLRGATSESDTRVAFIYEEP